jgi:hypothetical protein
MWLIMSDGRRGHNGQRLAQDVFARSKAHKNFTAKSIPALLREPEQ